jgi:hypothetical protein
MFAATIHFKTIIQTTISKFIERRLLVKESRSDIQNSHSKEIDLKAGANVASRSAKIPVWGKIREPIKGIIQIKHIQREAMLIATVPLCS